MLAVWARAKLLRDDALALYFAFRDGRTPPYAKAFIALIFVYVLSPFDLVPEFIPGIGFVDDLVVIPFGVTSAIRLIPPLVLSSSRMRAERVIRNGLRVVRWGLALLIGLGFLWAILAVGQQLKTLGN